MPLNLDRERGEMLSLDERFPRPAAVELAAAILIIGGILGLIGALGGAAGLPPGTGALLAVTIALDVSSIVVGALIRMGRLWIVAVNYVAVLAFLDLLAAGGSSIALIRGIGEIAAVVILLVYRSWFVARATRGQVLDEGESDRPYPLTPPTARPPTR
jgi:hypothetical protein